MSSSDRCTQPTCRLCSTRAGAPSSPSESTPHLRTRPNGPACPGRTTLPKVPAEGPALHQLPGQHSLACLGAGEGGKTEGRGHRLPAAGRWGFLGTTPHTPLQLPFPPQKNWRVCPLLWDPTFLLESWFFQTQHLCSPQLFLK